MYLIHAFFHSIRSQMYSSKVEDTGPYAFFAWPQWLHPHYIQGIEIVPFTWQKVKSPFEPKCQFRHESI
jgi:hypothetical protein